MNTKRKLLVILSSGFAFFLALVILAYLVLGPFISLYRIQLALEEKNEAEMYRLIDFPVLQENIKEDIRIQTKKAFGFDDLEQDSVLASFAVTIAEQMIDVSVEQVLTPATIGMLLSGKGLNELITEGVGVQAGIPSGEEELLESRLESSHFLDRLLEMTSDKGAYEYRSHREFVFYLGRGKTEPAPRELVFIRSGLVWKLSDVIF